MTTGGGVCKRRHVRQRGFTLIESLVTLAILAVIGGVIGSAFSVGLRMLGSGGAGDRLAASRDESSVEDVLGKDVARAACIETSNGAIYGGCTPPPPPPPPSGHGFMKTSVCTGAFLCIGWVQLASAPASPTCHIAVFTQPTSGPSSGQLVRTEYSVDSTASGNPTVVGSFNVTTRAQPLTLTATVTPVSVPRSLGPSYTWISELTVHVTDTKVASPPLGTFGLRPLSVDPSFSTAGIATTGPPC